MKIDRQTLAALFQAAILINGEPEDVTHNARVALANADALLKELKPREGEQF